MNNFKKQRWKLVGIGSLAVMLLLIAVAVYNTQAPEHTIEDFYFLRAGMSYGEITEKLGEPDQSLGSVFVVYELRDGSWVTLDFLTENFLISAFNLHRSDGTSLPLVTPPSPKE